MAAWSNAVGHSVMLVSPMARGPLAQQAERELQ